MKTITLLLSALFAPCTLAFNAPINELVLENIKKPIHDAWMVEHGIAYGSVEEEWRRFNVFLDNLEFVTAHNMRFSSGLESYDMKMNKMADMTHAEWKEKYLSYTPSTHEEKENHHGYIGIHDPSYLRSVPDTVDWRTKNAVTDVKDQAQCGSCWSFASTGSMEGAWAIAKSQLTPLSEEQLIDCVNNGQFDCKTGGDMVEAFKYVIKVGGITSESHDAYHSKDHQKCAYKTGDSSFVAKFTGYKTVTTNDENALKSAVAQQPVAIAIDASHQSFQFYSTGVYTEKQCCTKCTMEQLDHGVLAVGYGTEGGKDYWLVKNSWNSSWGDAGYIKIIRNDNGRCGVPASPSYPVV